MKQETQFSREFWLGKIGSRICVPGFFLIAGKMGIIAAVSEADDRNPFIVVEVDSTSFLVYCQYLRDVSLPDDTLPIDEE